MKKIVIILSAILLVVALAVPSFAAGFTPSVEQRVHRQLFPQRMPTVTRLQTAKLL